MYLNRPAPSLGLAGQSQLFAIPDGAEGVRATLYLMRTIALKYKSNPDIRHVAASLVSHLQQKDWVGEIKRLAGFVRDEIRYIRDIDEVETIQTPDKTLQLGYGDCDDKSTLLATLLLSIGHPARYVAVGTGPPGQFQHVFVDTLIGKNNWVPLETTEPVPDGWASPRITTEMILPVK